MTSYYIKLPLSAGGGGGGGTTDTLLRGKYVKSTRFISIGAGTSGSVTLPSNSTVVLDDFGGTVDAIVTKSSGGFPTLESAKDSSGTIIAATFDSSGNYTLSGTPSAYPVILVYRVRQTWENFDDTSSDIWGPVQTDLSGKEDTLNKATDFTIVNDVKYPTVQAVNTEMNTRASAAALYMFTSSSSDIGGYYQAKILTTYTPGSLTSVSQTVTTSETLLAAFATNSGFPSISLLPTGQMIIHYETVKSSGAQNYYTYCKLFKRTSGGVETLLLTSDNSSQTSLNTVQQVNVTILNTTGITLDTTERLVIKVYAIMVTGSATIAVRFDNGTDARIQLPSSAGSAVWGGIGGTLSNQSDLQTALNARVVKTGDTMTGPLAINGSTNAIQQTVKANGTQTANLIEYQNSSGTFLSGFDGSGFLRYPDTSAASAAAPQMYFVTGANKTGIGYNSAGINSELFFSTNGSSRLSMSVAGSVFTNQVYGNGNGATAPAFTLAASDSNTGLAYVAADSLCLATGGTARFTCANTLNTSSVKLTTTGLAVTAPSVPASASATGTAGDFAWDADYIYICTASNTWKRVAIATW